METKSQTNEQQQLYPNSFDAESILTNLAHGLTHLGICPCCVLRLGMSLAGHSENTIRERAISLYVFLAQKRLECPDSGFVDFERVLDLRSKHTPGGLIKLMRRSWLGKIGRSFVELVPRNLATPARKVAREN